MEGIKVRATTDLGFSVVQIGSLASGVDWMQPPLVAAYLLGLGNLAPADLGLQLIQQVPVPALWAQEEEPGNSVSVFLDPQLLWTAEDKSKVAATTPLHPSTPDLALGENRT